MAGLISLDAMKKMNSRKWAASKLNGNRRLNAFDVEDFIPPVELNQVVRGKRVRSVKPKKSNGESLIQGTASRKRVRVKKATEAKKQGIRDLESVGVSLDSIHSFPVYVLKDICFVSGIYAVDK